MRRTWRPAAGMLLRRAQRHLRLLGLSYPRKVECNICGWGGRRMLSDAWHPFTVCARCRSQVRHRLFAAVLTHSQRYGTERLFRGRRVLHFAPEALLSRVIREASAVYLTADLDRPGVDLELDMTAMRGLEEGAFDVVIAFDVLEHVPDDWAALAELYRILAPGGTAVLTVPQADGFRETYEDPDICSPEARQQAFGQADHVRMYGEDFAERLKRCGFEVAALTERDLEPELVRRHVLAPPVPSPDPLATNHRRLYFARRPDAGVAGAGP